MPRPFFKIGGKRFLKKKLFFSLQGKPILATKNGGGFIVFEGLDGSGQSTQAKLLSDFLRKKRIKVLLTKEPTLTSPPGKKIRKILDKKEKISPKKLQEFFRDDRVFHLKKFILPALKQGKIVISDRYFFSSFAYGKASGFSLDWLIKINEKFLMPDLTFILKVKPEICLKRIKKRGDKYTLFEKKEKLKKVFKNYLNFPKRFTGTSNGVYLIDGEKPIPQIALKVQKIITDNFLSF